MADASIKITEVQGIGRYSIDPPRKPIDIIVNNPSVVNECVSIKCCDICESFPPTNLEISVQ